MNDKNKLGILIAVILVLAILYVVFSAMKIITGLAIKILWIAFLVLLILFVIKKLTDKR
ncbi:hypothetical protein [Helcococcus sueciensis]|uniref:hypothetical protein n=1 Tax=Helcococcus sueciensis TaxID=241555 RepID=UPI00040649F9|nr:hypothetical protein [Helcococcus sueciensis]